LTNIKKRATSHFLLVEDNEGDILLTTEALLESPLVGAVSVARNGEEALDFLEKKGPFELAQTPDLILLDINLPRINGHEVLRRLKNTPALKSIPVIMLSTSSSDADIRLSYQNHVNCYITKPTDPGLFMEMISRLEAFWLLTVQLPKKYVW
jgi:CheY-like chemotaxis protein